MKKLMIAASVAAMIGGAEAVVCATSQCGDGAAGTAYKVAISLKTTAVKGKVTKLNSCDDALCRYWRQQSTKKINGLIWAQLEDCEGCYAFDPAMSAFWTNEGAVDAEFAIGIGLIGKKLDSKTIEAYGTLSGEEFGELAWAGFGSMAGTSKRASKCDEPVCVKYPKSISGGIAGWLIAPEWVGLCDDTCDPIEYEGCCADLEPLVNTAAYGSIKISYDASTAKKVALAAANGLELDNPATFYKLPAAAAATVADVVNEVTIEE